MAKIHLTASGGAVFGKTREETYQFTKEEALRHPNWSMGAKITVDSASMMNKGFEVCEAMHLYGVPLERIEVVIHRESIVHSMVEFCDGSVIAQLSHPRYAFADPVRADLSRAPTLPPFVR